MSVSYFLELGSVILKKCVYSVLFVHRLKYSTMIPTLQQTVALLLTYKYVLLFPLSIIEGPIVTVIGGFLASLHLMNWIIIYLIVIVGDVLGDGLMYSFGRFGGETLKKHGFRVGVTHERLEFAKKYFDEHHHKAIITSKLVHGIGVSGLVAAGVSKIPYLRFMRTCLLISLLQSAFFLIVGIFFGHAYKQIGDYLDYFAATVSLLVLASIFLAWFIRFKKNGIKIKST